MAGHERGRLSTALQIELGEDAADVVLDRLVREEQRGRDLLVGLPLGQVVEDAALLGGQLGQRVLVRPAGHAPDARHRLFGAVGIEQRAAATDRLEGRHKIAPPDLLEEIAAGAGGSRADQRRRVGIAGEDYHPRGR